MDRFDLYKKTLLEESRRQDVPENLAALPMSSTGFRNSVSGLNGGIWHLQVFGARMLGLTITDQIDERLDPEKATRAALHLLSIYNGFYHDWRLALIAYHSGPGFVFGHLDSLKTRDPWKIEAAAMLQDRSMAKVAADAILMEHAMTTPRPHPNALICKAL
jgi:membrane-bound lytic murein transglycosylase D